MSKTIISVLWGLMGLLAWTSAWASSVHLTWHAPTTNADGSALTDLAGFSVHSGTSPGLYGTTTKVGLVTTYELTGLTTGVTYYFSVTAEDTSGNVSDYSTEASATPTDTSQSLVLAPTGDTFINIDHMNYRLEPTLNTYTWPDFQIANAIILKFSLSALPADAVVHEAILHLFLVEADTADGMYTVTAHRLTANPTIGQTTGKRRTARANWTANPCCHQQFPMAQANIADAATRTAIDHTRGEHTWDVTSIIARWRASPSSNYGLLLNADPTQPADRYRLFASMEHPTASLRPSLTIRYRIP